MIYREMVKKIDKDTKYSKKITIAGMMNEEEIQEYKKDGYRNVSLKRYWIPVGK